MKVLVANIDNLDRIGGLVQKWTALMGYNVTLKEIVDDLAWIMKDGQVFYVEEGGEILGVMSGNTHWHYFIHEKIAHEHYYFVAPEHRGKGIGRVLTEAFSAWAKMIGCSSILIYPNMFGSTDPIKIKEASERAGFKVHGYSMIRTV